MEQNGALVATSAACMGFEFGSAALVVMPLPRRRGRRGWPYLPDARGDGSEACGYVDPGRVAHDLRCHQQAQYVVLRAEAGSA